MAIPWSLPMAYRPLKCVISTLPRTTRNQELFNICRIALPIPTKPCWKANVDLLDCFHTDLPLVGLRSEQSSTHADFSAEYANDGHDNTFMRKRPYCSHTCKRLDSTNKLGRIKLACNDHLWILGQLPLEQSPQGCPWDNCPGVAVRIRSFIF